MSATPFAMGENLALMAGAGAGKTHGLISLALHALAGVRADGAPVPPGALLAVTFTEKAAAELKERLRRRVRALADGTAAEPELAASFAALGRPAPPRAFWEDVHARLGGAFVGTFHALCAQLLRRHAVEAGVDPRFRLLDEGGASELFGRAAERSLLRALEGGGPARDGAGALVRALGLRGKGEHGAGLLDLLAAIHAQLAEDGRSAEALAPPAAGPFFLGARDALAGALRRAIEPAGRLEIDEVGPRRLGELSGLEPEGARRGLALADELRAALHLKSAPRPRKEGLKALREEALVAFERACAEVLASPLHAAFAQALAAAERAYRGEKERRGALDFADLVRGAHDLLRDDGPVRRDAHARVGALLVDEFQDTNRLQLDLVALLAERREGAPRAVAGSAFEVLPLERGLLASVGDLKQSIYEFRGADVSVFASVARRFQAGEGSVQYLTQNRRSRPALLRFFNALFARAMAPAKGDPPWRVGYRSAHDDLTPWRPEGPSGPCVELLRAPAQDGRECRALEARAMARRIAEMLAPGAPPLVGRDRRGGELAPPRGGDIAVLLRRFTHLEVYRRALAAQAIPHLVVRGGGFFRAPEVVDLRQLLALLGQPGDRLALACVLRSPLVGLGDASLCRLGLERRLSLARLPEAIGQFEAGERERVAALLDLLSWLRPASAHLPVARVLEAAIEALDLEAVLACGAEGEQAIANLRKLVAWAGQADPGDPWSAARRLEELAAGEGREAQASVLDPSDPLAVRLMTVHQAKGLEFPIVFVPDCGALPQPPRGAVLFDRQLGLCVRPLGDDGRALATLSSERVSRALASRQAAESERLLYVAATRARDLLVLSGEGSRARGTWREPLDAFAAQAEAEGLLRIVEGPGAAGSPSAPPLAPTVAGEGARGGAVSPAADAAGPEGIRGAGDAAAAVARALSPARLRPRARAWTLAQVLDHATCPRRYHLRHVIGLGEARPAALSREGPAEPGESPRLAGTEPLALPEALLAAPALRGLGRARVPRFWRAVPAALRLEIDPGVVVVRGTLDVLAVLDDGAALALGLSSGASGGAAPERTALWRAFLHRVGRAALPAGVPIRAAVGFLADARAQGSPEGEAGEAEQAALAARVQGLAREAAGPRGAPPPERLASERCRALRCGYARFCHGPKTRSPRAGTVL